MNFTSTTYVTEKEKSEKELTFFVALLPFAIYVIRNGKGRKIFEHHLHKIILRKGDVDMPYRSNTPCKHPGCAKLVPYGSKYCKYHEALHRSDRDSASRRGYNSRWQKARVRYLHSHPLCVECKKAGKLTQATVVDHIVPHRGDQKLFWDESNWQPLCKPCHDKKTWNEDNNPTYKF